MTEATLLNEDTDFDAAFSAASAQMRRKPAEQKKPEPPIQESEESQPEQEQPETQASAPEQAEPPSAEDQLRAQLQDALRERDEALHKWKSDANRQSHLMRENNQLREQINALKSEVEKLKQQPSQAAKIKSDAELNDVLDSAPELKSAVERRIQNALDEGTRELRDQLSAALQQISEVGQTAQQAAQRIEPLASREEQRSVEEARAQLDKLFPSWRRDVVSTDFQQWLGRQPAEVQSKYPGQTIDDAAAVLTRFYAATGVPTPPSQGTTNKLKNAAGIAPRTVTRPVTNPDDFDGAFAEFAQKRKS